MRMNKIKLLIQKNQTVPNTCVYASTQRIRMSINDFFLQHYKHKCLKSQYHFRLSVMSDERWLWVETSPFDNHRHSLCHCVKNPVVRLAARRRESHPFFRLLSAGLLSRPIFLIKLPAHNAGPAQWLVVQLL